MTDVTFEKILTIDEQVNAPSNIPYLTVEQCKQSGKDPAVDEVVCMDEVFFKELHDSMKDSFDAQYCQGMENRKTRSLSLIDGAFFLEGYNATDVYDDVLLEFIQTPKKPNDIGNTYRDLCFDIKTGRLNAYTYDGRPISHFESFDIDKVSDVRVYFDELILWYANPKAMTYEQAFRAITGGMNIRINKRLVSILDNSSYWKDFVNKAEEVVEDYPSEYTEMSRPGLTYELPDWLKMCGLQSREAAIVQKVIKDLYMPK